MKSICFTGHRNLKGDTEQLEKELYNELEKSITELGVTVFVNGLARGWDMLSARSVLTLREIYPQIKLHLVLPCPNEEQTAKWSDEEKTEFYRILKLADSIEYISDCYYDGCMKARNARLVELSDCCFCYWNPKRQRSGTAQTVRMAHRKDILIVNFYNAHAKKD